MKKLVYIGLFIVLHAAQSVFGQAQFSISQYYQTQAILNPSFTGVDDFLDIKIGFRKKWAGLNNSPTTTFISAMSSIGNNTSYNQSPIRISNSKQINFVKSQQAKLNSHGIGGYIIKQEQGAFNQIKVMMNYAYHIPLNSKLRMSMGSSIGINNIKVNLEEISVWDKMNDPTYQAYANGNNNYTQILVNIGGVLYGKKSYLGISYLPILGVQLTGEEQELSSEEKLILMTGTKFTTGPNMTMIPSLLVELNSSNQTKVIGSFLVDIKSIIKTGFTYSSTKDVSFNVMFNYKKDYGLAYAFETSVGNETSIGNGTHEFILTFNLLNRLNSAPRLW